MMEIASNGWVKIHIGCGGQVRFVENLNGGSPGWFLECVECGTNLYEEDVEFREDASE